MRAGPGDLLPGIGSLIVFQLVGCDEGVERGPGVLARLVSAIHISAVTAWLGLLALRQFAKDVGGLVHPAALLARGRPQLAKRLPEAKRAIGDGEFGRDRQARFCTMSEGPRGSGVFSEIPIRRMTSATSVPVSACFRAKTICSPINLLFFTAPLLALGSYKAGKLAFKPEAKIGRRQCRGDHHATIGVILLMLTICRPLDSGWGN
jgi:hypothetical protein